MTYRRPVYLPMTGAVAALSEALSRGQEVSRSHRPARRVQIVVLDPRSIDEHVRGVLSRKRERDLG